MTQPPAWLYRRRRVILATLIVLWLAAFTLSHIPGEDVPDFHVSDKLLHTVGFLGLATTFALTLQAYGLPRTRRIVLVILIMLAYGALDELTQPYFHRSCELLDWVSDAVGTTAALLLTETLAFLLGRTRGMQKD